MKAFVTRVLPEEAMKIVRAGAEIVDVWPHELPPGREELLTKVADVEGLLCLLTDKIDADILSAAPRLKVVSQMAVGYDNIDVPACKSRGIAVGNTPGVLTETTADLAFALLLATARKIVEAEKFLRQGDWQTWSPMLLTGPDIHHATLGIVGMGSIGFEMARRAHGFEMEILYASTRQNSDAENHFGAKLVDLDTLLSSSDFVSLHTPLNATTRNLIGRRELALMKRTAILINSSRGPVIDQSALIKALEKGKLAGAGLDVFEQEPLPLSDPLLTLPNVVLLPHIGSASIATRTRMAVLAAENLVAGIQGKPLPNPIG